jgi:hypothetical protein
MKYYEVKAGGGQTPSAIFLPSSFLFTAFNSICVKAEWVAGSFFIYAGQQYTCRLMEFMSRTANLGRSRNCLPPILPLFTSHQNPYNINAVHAQE